ncbi:MAG TPA: pyridine nucleotide-disulfide oxidoreductase, partial [Actinomycetota bacterium]|nr:pyridine nucleotide-disulfide oxidoreductase [Actinomycetota bacterium]
MLDRLATDLERRFGDHYRILAEGSPAAALATLERLARGAEPVALVVAARRMEELDGLALLARARELHPSAKRVLMEHRGEWTSGE